jgi:hypothetical protein
MHSDQLQLAPAARTISIGSRTIPAERCLALETAPTVSGIGRALDYAASGTCLHMKMSFTRQIQEQLCCLLGLVA